MNRKRKNHPLNILLDVLAFLILAVFATLIAMAPFSSHKDGFI